MEPNGTRAFIPVEKDTVPISWLLSSLEGLGLNRADLLHCAGIERNEEQTEDELTADVDQYNSIFACASDALREPAVGLKIFPQTTMDQFGLVTLLGNSGPTVMQSWINMCRYQRTFSSVFLWAMEADQNRARLFYSVKGASAEQSRGDIELSLALAMKRLVTLPAFDARRSEVSFAYSKPDDTSLYEQYFGQRLRFDSDCNSISIPSDLLGARLPGSDTDMSRILESRVRAILDDLVEKPDLVRKVEAIIALGLGKNPMSIESVASALFMHHRTLHRKLIQHGTSFRQIKDQVVIRAAQEALLHTSLNLTSIAHKLGFSENSAFSRTFKRVCDVTPSAYRDLGRELIN